MSDMVTWIQVGATVVLATSTVVLAIATIALARSSKNLTKAIELIRENIYQIWG